MTSLSLSRRAWAPIAWPLTFGRLAIRRVLHLHQVVAVAAPRDRDDLHARLSHSGQRLVERDLASGERAIQHLYLGG